MNTHLTAAPAKLAVVTAALFMLSACEGKRADLGPMRTEERDIGGFDSIDMEGAARLQITVGSPVSLVLEGRDREIERVSTEVRGDKLYIRTRPTDWFIPSGGQRLTLKITVPELDDLRLEGGNEVRVSGFDGGQAKITSAGAASIEAEGRLDTLTIRLAGAGHGDFSKLIAGEAKVTVDGVGSVIVHPKDTLDATMNGVGAILYTGSPREVNTRMNGLGTIGRRDSGSMRNDAEAGKEGTDAEEAGEDVGPSDIDPEKLQPEYEQPKPKKKKVELI